MGADVYFNRKHLRLDHRKILRHLDLWDVHNHEPPQKVSDYILELVCDETDSRIPAFDEWY